MLHYQGRQCDLALLVADVLIIANHLGKYGF